VLKTEGGEALQEEYLEEEEEGIRDIKAELISDDDDTQQLLFDQEEEEEYQLNTSGTVLPCHHGFSVITSLNSYRI